MSNRFRPLVTAHSGCEESLENTVASVISGMEAGADMVEIDIRTSLDGKPVLTHDPWVYDNTGKRILISETPYSVIKQVLESQTGKCTALEDILEVIKDQNCMLNLDLKDIGSIENINRIITSHRLLDFVVFSGCGTAWSSVIRKTYPKMQVFLNVQRVSDSGCNEPSYLHIQDICRNAVELGCCGININYAVCSSTLVEYARKRLLPVSVWTVNNEEEMKQMLHMGVFSITTYFPKKLIQLINAGPQIGHW